MSPTRIAFTEKPTQLPFPADYNQQVHMDLVDSGHIIVTGGRRRLWPWNYPDLNLAMLSSQGSALLHAPERDVIMDITSDQWGNFLIDLGYSFFEGIDGRTPLKIIIEHQGRGLFFNLLTQRADTGHFMPSVVRMMANDFRIARSTPGADDTILEDQFISNASDSSITLYESIRERTYETVRHGGMIHFM